MDKIIEIRNLSIEIQDKGSSEIVRAVNGANLFIERGKTLGIVGESGSGKTMTALSVMNLLKENAKVTKGAILYNGEDMLSMGDKRLRELYGRHIAMIFQEPMASLNPLMKIGRQVEENASLHLGLKGAELKSLALAVMAQCGLEGAHIYNAYPHQLSGGMRQRVMIASAIICRPQLLVADEPTTALDVTIQAQILILLKSLVDGGDMSMLFISHDFGVISQICDWVAVMYQGYVMEFGSCEAVISKPAHPYTISLIKCIPSNEKKGTPLYHIKPDTVHEMQAPGMCPYFSRCGLADAGCNTTAWEEQIITDRFVRCVKQGAL